MTVPSREGIRLARIQQRQAIHGARSLVAPTLFFLLLQKLQKLKLSAPLATFFLQSRLQKHDRSERNRAHASGRLDGGMRCFVFSVLIPLHSAQHWYLLSWLMAPQYELEKERAVPSRRSWTGSSSCSATT
jgi:hypothetical protein